jgi:hypothetical protein
MKTGLSIAELAGEIERRRDAKKDFIVNTSHLQMFADVETAPSLVFGDNTTDINEIAHDQIGTHLEIPSKYYDRMRREAPVLLADNVNEWFRRFPAPRLLRTMDKTARAFLSDTYRPLENEDLAEAVLPILHDLKLDIMSCDVTDRRLYIKAVDERLKADGRAAAGWATAVTCSSTRSRPPSSSPTARLVTGSSRSTAASTPRCAPTSP